MPPYIIYQGARLYDAWCPRNGFQGTRYNVTESGWVDETVFYDWLTKHFVPSVKTIKRPIMLLFDGHSAHISTRIIRAALDNQIELECLPPHTTTILQPLDVATLTKVKTAWRQLLNDHNLKTNSAPIDKSRFALLVNDCLPFNPMFACGLVRFEIYGEIT
jgi:DDE superfamily endonuclease